MVVSMLVAGAVRASLVLLAALLVCAAMTRASAAARRALLVTALSASVLVPLLALVSPRWRVAAPAELAVFARESPLEGRTPSDSSVERTALEVSPVRTAPFPATIERTPAMGLVALWLLGVVALVGRAVASQLRARRLVRRGTALEPRGWSAEVLRVIDRTGLAVDVRLCPGLDSPAVTGIVRSTVLLPREAATWSGERTRVVLLHELAHVARRDGAAQLMADAACALHWCNPLVWLVAWRLRIERELAADDAVLASGVRPSSYAEELLALAGPRAVGAHGMAERTTLGDRIVAILARGRRRSPLAARGRLILAGGSVLFGAAAACAAPEVVRAPLGAETAHHPRAADASDPVAQAAADDVLASVVAAWSAEAAVVLVLDASTGEILADAGRVGNRPFDVARSRAITPGSTLKPITIAAALDSGSITSTQLFDCGPAPRAYGAKEIHDGSSRVEELGSRPLDAAHLLAVSSNIGTSRIFDALGGERMSGWLARFHFTEAPRLEGATSGVVPGPIGTGSYEGALVAMGEGITATPLQMAAAYAAIASDGVYHAPTAAGAPSPGERLVSPTTARQVMAMLDTAVTDPSATGLRARVEGVHVGGKTGTAEFTDAAGRPHTYASFVGVADLPARRLVALVGVETSRQDVSGGEAAAPAFARLVTRLR